MSGRRRLRRLLQDRRANAAVYTALVASVLLGMVGLALDGSRAMITDSEAQAAADAAALAAGAQLDGAQEGCDAAKAAALVSNSQRFGAGGKSAVQITSVRCLSELPDDDSAAGTENEGEARFVEVTTQSVSHANTFLQAVGAPASSTVQASAVAGFSSSVCRVTPMYMCSPVSNLTEALFGSLLEGRSIDLWQKLGGGSFGLLSMPPCTSNSASCFREQIAEGANVCVRMDEEVQTLSGGKTGQVEKGLEDRFDADKNHGEYELDALDGSWNCAAYWARTHGAGAAPPPSPAGSSETCDSTARKPLTRRYVYDYEQSVRPKAAYYDPGGVDGARLLYFAIADSAVCPLGGNASTTPVAYVEALLLKRDGRKTAWVEVTRMLRPGSDDGALRENVQLYR